MSVKGDLTVIYSIGWLDSGVLAREARQRSTMGKKIWSTIHPGKFGYDVAYERPSVHPLHVSRCQMSGYFGGKAYGHPRLVKQRQLKSQ